MTTSADIRTVTPRSGTGGDPGAGAGYEDAGVPPTLQVTDLVVSSIHHKHQVKIVEKVSLSIAAGETYGLVGESGSGKSMTSLAILGLLRRMRYLHVSGSVRLDGTEILNRSRRDMTSISGARIGMVFQDPMSSLNPSFKIGSQIAEPLRRHKGMSRKQASAQALELLRLVEIPGAARVLNAYPHELSGGMRQRVMLAIALSCRPELLIADEPTTALDVTVQAQLLALIRRLQQEMHMAVLFITHDLAVLADIADRVGVMYSGQLVEEGSVFDIFERTRHPYSSALVRSSPEYLTIKAGSKLVASQAVASTGCRFRPRCEFALPACTQEQVLSVVPENPGQRVRCIRMQELSLPSAIDLWNEKNQAVQDALLDPAASVPVTGAGI